MPKSPPLLVPRRELQPEGSGTTQRPWERHKAGFSTYNSALAAVGTYDDLIAVPSDSPSTGVYVMPLDYLDQLLLAFAGTDADNETASGRLWLIQPEERIRPPSNGGRVQDLAGYWAMDLAITLGASTPTSGSRVWDGANTFFADTVAISADNTFNASGKVFGGAGSRQVLALDTLGAQYAVLQLTRSGGTAASICPIWSQR